MSRQEIFALLRRRWSVSLVVAAYLLGGVHMLTSMLRVSRITAALPPAAVAHLGARLEIVGKDVTRAGGTSVALDAKLLQLRQTCAEACDRIVVSYGTAGDSLYKLRVLDPRGECVLCQGVYSEGHNDDRVTLGVDAGLKLQTGLFGY